MFNHILLLLVVDVEVVCCDISASFSCIFYSFFSVMSFVVVVTVATL